MQQNKFQTDIDEQLKDDFYYYAGKDSGLIKIDWSEAIPEDHDTMYFTHYLESYSGLLVRDDSNTVIAWGWMEFIYAGRDEPFFVFWAYLCFGHPEEDRPDVVQSQWIPPHHGKSRIPQHIWDHLPESTKDKTISPEVCDTRWHNDPLVLQWEKQRSHK